MKFNKDLKVDIKTLTRKEAVEFVEFLREERDRHLYAIELAKLRVAGASHRKKEALGKFYETAIKRHLLDIEDIDKLISKVKEMYDV